MGRQELPVVKSKPIWFRRTPRHLRTMPHGLVLDLATLGDGRLASVGEDRTIKIWNLRSRELSGELSAPDGEVPANFPLATLGDGRLASGSSEDQIKIWNISEDQWGTWGHAASHLALLGHPERVDITLALAALEGGRLASTHIGSDLIYIWNLARGDCVAKLGESIDGHAGSVSCLAALEGGRLVSGSFDRKVKIWNVADGACIATLTGHGGRVWALAILESGRLASASGDMTIRIWEIATRACVATLEGHRGSVRSLALLNGRRLASGSSDQTVKVWEVAHFDEAPRHHTGTLDVACLATLRLADTVLAIAPIPTSTAITVASGNSISIHNLESLDSR